MKEYVCVPGWFRVIRILLELALCVMFLLAVEAFRDMNKIDAEQNAELDRLLLVKSIQHVALNCLETHNEDERSIPTAIDSDFKPFMSICNKLDCTHPEDWQDFPIENKK